MPASPLCRCRIMMHVSTPVDAPRRKAVTIHASPAGHVLQGSCDRQWLPGVCWPMSLPLLQPCSHEACPVRAVGPCQKRDHAHRRATAQRLQSLVAMHRACPAPQLAGAITHATARPRAPVSEAALVIPDNGRFCHAGAGSKQRSRPHTRLCPASTSACMCPADACMHAAFVLDQARACACPPPQPQASSERPLK